jgi:hypothetical protein
MLLMGVMVGWSPLWAAPPTTQNLHPVSGLTNVSTNPTLELDCNSSSLVAAQYQIDTTTSFSSPTYDSGENSNTICSHVAFASLNGSTQYFWRGRVKNASNEWSSWSSTTSFTTFGGTTFQSEFQDGLLNYGGTADTDLRGDGQNPTQVIREWNQGAQDVLRTGRRPAGSATDEIYRSLLKFDLSSLTNPNAVVTAYLEITGGKHGGSNDNVQFDGVNLMYEVVRPWAEGESLFNLPTGPGESSWSYSSFPSEWSIPGVADASDSDPNADRKSTPLVEYRATNLEGLKSVWSSQALIDAVKNWISQPSANQGVLIRAEDESVMHTMNFAAREHSNPTFRPRLVVESTEQAVITGNIPPIAHSDTGITVEGTSVSISVLNNDSDPDNGPQPLHIDSVDNPSHGSVQIVGSDIVYLADIGFVGNDSFRYHLSDGESVVSTTVDTTNVSAVNLAPTVNAGADQTITSLAPANLNATVIDDGLPIPPGAVTVNWIVVSGPGTVTFGDPTQAATTAHFSQIGNYVLRLTASDGVLSANDEITIQVDLPPSPGTRITNGLIVYYPFTEGVGSTVLDQSNVGSPMDLTLTGNVTWNPGGNGVVMSGGKVGTSGPATKVISALQTSSQLTVELWVVPDNLTQDGPARMLSIGGNTSDQNYMFGQQFGELEIRTLHTGKDSKGKPRFYSINSGLTTTLTHIVHTYDGTTERLYMDGVVHPTTVTSAGNFSNWDPTDLFNIANEASSDRPWHGTILIVAVYDRALANTEIIQNFTAGPNGGTVVNQPPVALDDQATTNIDTSVGVVVLTNDTDDVSLDPTTVLVVNQPTNGSASVDAAGVVTYSPNLNFTGQDSFAYTVQDNEGLVSNVGTVTITVTAPGTPPSIFSQPTNVTVTEPNGATFTVIALGDSPITYQWRRNGVNIAGATSATYILTPTSVANDHGEQFDVVIRNPFGSVISQLVTLTVNQPLVPPTIDSFTAVPSTVLSGGASTLMWATTNATSVDISQGVGTGLASIGSVTVNPLSTTSYVLTAFGPGGSDIASVTVTVTTSSNTFMDITTTSGTGGPNWFGGHGVQFADVTENGRPDFYVTMNWNQNMAELFYRNVDGVTFVEEAQLRGIDNFDTGSHGGVWGDLDNDGDFDLFNGSYDQNRIYRNDGIGQYSDVTGTSGLPIQNWKTRGVVSFDMDNDGDLDLFAVTGFEGSGDPASERNEVYRNDGNLQFTSIETGDLFTAPAGQGATDSDFDGDGDIDIFTANRDGDLNILQNDGAGNFTLLNPSTLGITHRADNGISVADLNNDGHLDLLLESHLYLNTGSNSFVFQQTFTEPGYMGGFEDLDNDGDWDLVFAGDNKVYFNDGTGSFNTSGPFSLGTIDDPRAVAFADIDGDGDSDFFYAQKRTFNQMIRNDYTGSNQWVNVRLLRANGQVGAFGAKVYVYQAGQLGNDAARIAWREARSQVGYLAQNDPTLHFGVGQHGSVDIRVVFLGGITVDQTNVSSSQTLTIQETGGPGVSPSIVTEPVNLTVTEPDSATFTVVATGDAPLSYQWRRDGVNISGATGANYTMNSTAVTDNGAQFDVVVTNPVGTVTSQVALLTVNSPLVPIIDSFTAVPNSIVVGGSSTLAWTTTNATSVDIDQGVGSGLAADGNVGVTPVITTTYTLTAQGPGGSTISSVTMTVNAAPVPPSIVTQPTNLTVTEPNAAMFSVVAAGDAPLSYQWRRDGIDIPGATGTSYTLTPTSVAGDDGAGFDVVVTNPVGTVTSQSALLTVQAPPPVGARVTQGLVVFYPFNEGGGVVVSDQSNVGTPMDLGISGNVVWNPNGHGVIMSSGAIMSLGSATKVNTTLQASSMSTFEVWVVPGDLKVSSPIISIDSGGFSQNMVLGQKKNDLEMGLLHTDKKDGNKPRLETGDDPVTTNLMHIVHTYDGTTEKLFVDGVQHPSTVVRVGNYSNWETTDVFSVGNLSTLGDAWEGLIHMAVVYDRPLTDVEVQQNFVAGPQGSSTPPVNQAPVAQDDFASTDENTAVVIGVLINDTDDGTIDASSVLIVTNPGNGSAVSDATGAVTYTPNFGFIGTDTFTYTVDDTLGLTSNGATVSVTVNVVPIPPVIVTQPVNVSVTEPDPATFTVVATGDAPLSYQWRRDGVNISGATSTSYTLMPTAVADNGAQFDVVVTNPVGVVSSQAALLTVTALPQPPTIVTQPVGVTVTEPNAATFTVVATGNAPLSYQWRRDGVDISGALSASYTLTPTVLADSGAQFDVVVTNSLGTVTSQLALLTVNVAPIPPSIVTEPVDVTVTEPTGATFSVIATGDAPLSYQWRRNGVNVSGATGTSYTLNPTTVADSGAQFDVVVTNPAGSQTSQVATLTVLLLPVPPSIVTQPGGVTVTEPNGATFSVVATGDAPLTYQWRRDGLNISGAVTSSYTLTPTSVSADDGVQFDVVVTNPVGTVTSQSALLTVQAPPPVGSRVTNGLVVFYPFNEGSGTSVTDQSNVGTPMNLGISGNVTWNPTGNGVVMTGGADVVASLGSGSKVLAALQLTNTSTFEAWIEPTHLKLVAPIISIDSGSNSQNMLMGQKKNDFEMGLLHTGKKEGNQPRLETGTDPITKTLIHVVHTFDGTTEKLFVDGVQHPTTVVRVGDYSTWETTDVFSIGNLATLSEGWKGTMRLVAVYDRPLADAEVQQNFTAGPTGQ